MGAPPTDPANGEGEHVHLLVNFPPKVAPARLAVELHQFALEVLAPSGRSLRAGAGVGLKDTVPVLGHENQMARLAHGSGSRSANRSGASSSPV